jgi:hypothetical protein
VLCDRRALVLRPGGRVAAPYLCSAGHVRVRGDARPHMCDSRRIDAPRDPTLRQLSPVGPVHAQGGEQVLVQLDPHHVTGVDAQRIDPAGLAAADPVR